MGAHLGQWRREPANRRHPRLDRLDRHPGAGADRPQPRPVPGGRASSAGGGNVALLAEQALEFGVEVVAVAKATAAQDLQLAFYAEAQRKRVRAGRVPDPQDPRRPGRRQRAGREAVRRRAQRRSPARSACRRRWPRSTRARTLALANKESLVVGGPLVTAPGASPGQIVPVDSEHSRARPVPARRHGRRGAPAGADRERWPVPGRTRGELADVTPEQALAHPTWDMGPVVTINSATLVNKGLEVIEAHLLFGVPYGPHRGRGAPAVGRPLDGRVRRRLDDRAGRPPDMRLPIALALGWPDRIPDASPPVDWTEAAPGSSSRSTTRRSRRSGSPARPATRGGTAPAVFNAANEDCVAGVPGRAAAVPGDRRHRGPGGDRTRRTLV